MPPKKNSNKASVEALLSDLDSLGVDEEHEERGQAADAAMGSNSTTTTTTTTSTAHAEGDNADADDPQALLDDLEGLVKRRSGVTKVGGAATTAAAAAAAAAEKLEVAPAPDKVREQAEESSTTATATTTTTTTTTPATATTPATTTTAASTPNPAPATATPATTTTTTGWGSWGGSVWSSAAKLADHARAELEKRAAAAAASASSSEQAQHLSSRVRTLVQDAAAARPHLDFADFDLAKLDLARLGEAGRRGWSGVVNAVAPPISAHEVIQVTLSTDMRGFDGVQDVVFKVLGRVMESMVRDRGTEQQLVVNVAPPRANDEMSPAAADDDDDDDARDIRAVQGYDAAWAAADDALTRLVEHAEPPKVRHSSFNVPVTYCPVFLRVQAVVATLPGAAGPGAGQAEGAQDAQQNVAFLLVLQDPTNGLVHRTCSQTFPYAWLSEPFESNPWIEQSMVEVLECALGVVAHDYVSGRQSGRSRGGGGGGGGAGAGGGGAEGRAGAEVKAE